MEKNFKHNSFVKRLGTMMHVDIRRMFTMPLFSIMVGVCLIIPVLILVMTTMMDGSVSINPQTGEETVIEGFDNTWQAIGTISGEGTMMDMSLTGMCNINMLYFFIAVFVCIFISEDFRSGFSKNLFTVRAKKTDYVISKTVAGIIAGICMLFAFFLGAMVGGAVSGLPFDIGVASIYGIVMCMISKMLLVAVFVPIYVLAGICGKQKLWLSLIVSLMIGMLFFAMIPMLTPLNSTITNVIICLVSGVLFSVGLGAISNKTLKRISLV